MTISAIKASPSVGLPGTRIQLSPEGSYESSLELRWYVQSAPASSALLTLETYQDLRKERVDARLKTNAAGAELVPDVPGRYTVALYPTTLYRFRKGWSDALPAAGQLAEADNEEEALPAYAGGTAAVTPLSLDIDVAETFSMGIGQGADTATLKLISIDNEIVTSEAIASLLTAPVELTPGSSAAAKVAAFDPDVLTVLDAIEAETTGSLVQNLAIGWGDLYIGDSTSAVDPLLTLVRLVDLWNLHLALATAATTYIHGAADATNVISSPEATNLATAIALLNEARTDHEAHRVNVASATHLGADNQASSTITAPVATDFASAVTLWADLWSKFNHHASSPDPVHVDSGAGSPIDGNSRRYVEAPRTTQQLAVRANLLKATFNAHVAKVSEGVGHDTADADNVVSSTPALYSLEGVAKVVNDLADSIEKHAQNKQADGTDAAAPYHKSGSNPITDPSAKVPLRCSAQNPESITKALSYCLLAMQTHGLNASVHVGAIWGQFAPTLSTWPLHPRLTKAWTDSVAAVSPIVPAHFNSAASLAKLLYGAKLRCRLDARGQVAERSQSGLDGPVPEVRCFRGRAADDGVPVGALAEHIALAADVEAGAIVRRWCVVTKNEPSREAARLALLAARLQRVQVPPRQASEHRVAGPSRAEETPTAERGVESPRGGESRAAGSKHAGRNMK